MYNVPLLHHELMEANLPISSISLTDEIVIKYERELTVEEQTLADTIIADHDPNKLTPWEEDDIREIDSRTSWKDLGVWATWEAQQAQDYVDSEILNGWDVSEAETWIEDNVTTLETAKDALKVLAGSIITTRNILGIIAKVILYIRDILIKRL